MPCLHVVLVHVDTGPASARARRSEAGCPRAAGSRPLPSPDVALPMVDAAPVGQRPGPAAPLRHAAPVVHKGKQVHVLVAVAEEDQQVPGLALAVEAGLSGRWSAGRRLTHAPVDLGILLEPERLRVMFRFAGPNPGRWQVTLAWRTITSTTPRWSRSWLSERWPSTTVTRLLGSRPPGCGGEVGVTVEGVLEELDGKLHLNP